MQNLHKHCVFVPKSELQITKPTILKTVHITHCISAIYTQHAIFRFERYYPPVIAGLTRNLKL